MRAILGALTAIAVGLAGGLAAEPLIIFAPSSLRDAVTDIANGYDGHDAPPVLVFAATSAIARQIAQGAPADVVLFADEDWATWSVEQGVISDVTPFASNRLSVIGQTGAEPLGSFEELAARLRDGPLAVAQMEAVPAGRYARAALLASGMFEALEGQIVQAANVRAALRFVERGEAELGIGYASDLVALPDLAEVYAIPSDLHPPILYSGAGLTDEGRSFVFHLTSQDAQSALADWGFLPPPAP